MWKITLFFCCFSWVTLAYASSPCTQTPNPTRLSIGKFQGVALTVVAHRYADNIEDEYGCVSLQYTYKGKKFDLYLASYTVREIYFENAFLKSGKIHLVEGVDSRSTDAGTTQTLMFGLDLRKGVLIEKGGSTTSPAEEEQAALIKILRAGKLEEAIKRVSELDTCPNGNFCIAARLFETMTPLFLGALKKVSSLQERTGLLKRYLLAWMSPENTMPFGTMLKSWEWYNDKPSDEIIKAAPLFHQVAQELAAGLELALAQEILLWQLEFLPVSFNTHRLLATTYRELKQASLADKHNFIADRQEEMVTGKKMISAVTPTLTAEEKLRWLDWEEITLEGTQERCVNFTQVRLAPFTIDARDKDGHNFDGNLKSFSVARTACFNRTPLLQATVYLDESRQVRSGALAVEFKLKDVWCAKDTGFSLKPGRGVKCTTSRVQTVDGVPLAAGTEVIVGSDGKLDQFVPNEDWTVKGYRVAKGARVGARVPQGESGLLQVTLAAPLTTGDVTWPAGTYLNPTGRELPKPDALKDTSLEVVLKTPVRLSGVLVQDRCYLDAGFQLTSGLLAQDWKGPEGECAKGKFINLPNPAKKQELWCRPPLF